MPEARAPHEHRGTRAIQRMVEYAPSTGGLALWVLHEDLAVSPDAPAVATDGRTVHYGSRFESLTLAQQTGLVAHEVLHVALRHPQRYRDLERLLGDVDLELFNICADAIVNSAIAHLTWLSLPASAVRLDRLLSSALGIDQDVERSLLEWDVERLYRAIDDRRRQGTSGRSKQQRAQRGSGDGNRRGTTAREAERDDGARSSRVRALGSGTDIDLLTGSDGERPPELEAEEAREWSERILRAHAGDAAHSMLRTLLADLPKIRTPWEQVLRTQLSRALSLGLDISWSRPSRSYLANQGRGGPHRRLPWEPGHGARKSVPRLVLIVDVSGSIEDALLERFAREIEAMTRRLEAGLVLVIGDDCVRQVTHFEPGRSNLRDIEFHGRGGTDFTPLLEEANRHDPDITVVLTDLEGPARFRPRWPTLWAVPKSHATAVPPFGRLLVLD